MACSLYISEVNPDCDIYICYILAIHIFVSLLIPTPTPNFASYRKQCVKVSHCTVAFSLFPFSLKIFNVYSMVLYTQIYIVIFSWWINTFVVMKCSALTLVLFLAFSWTISDVNVVTELYCDVCMVCSFHPFTLSLRVFLYLTCVPCKQHFVI